MRRTNRPFGIEMEFNCSFEDLKINAADAIKRIYGPRKYYAKDSKFSSINNKTWHIKSEDYQTSEVTTPVSILSNLRDIKKVFGIISCSGLEVADDCGFHIHFSVGDIDPYLIGAAWLLCEKSIFKCFPPSRLKNIHLDKVVRYPSYEKKQIANFLEDTIDNAHTETLSLLNYTEMNTIEIRIAESTLDIKFIDIWVNFCLYWLEYIKKINSVKLACKLCNSMGIDDIMNEMKLPTYIEDGMMDRYDKYSNNSYWV